VGSPSFPEPPGPTGLSYVTRAAGRLAAIHRTARAIPRPAKSERIGRDRVIADDLEALVEHLVVLLTNVAVGAARPEALAQPKLLLLERRAIFDRKCPRGPVGVQVVGIEAAEAERVDLVLVPDLPATDEHNDRNQER
jgi:hypothetical protein